MLLIPDIHTNSKTSDRIIAEISAYIQNHPNEEDVVFLWDYVYMFSYDRVALMQLYTLWIEIRQSGKNCYVLAGNHDWIKDTFVFEEAKKAFDIINLTSIHKLYFITSPLLTVIAGQTILFLPYMIHPSDEALTLDAQGTLPDTIRTLSQSKDTNERLSAHANSILYTYAEKYKDLTVIHHYYVEHTMLPWQRSTFDYKKVALSRERLSYPGMRLISGHIHQPSSIHNRLVCGSLRSVTASESHQAKYLWQYDVVSHHALATEVWINPYLTIDYLPWHIIDQGDIKNLTEQVSQISSSHFLSPAYQIKVQKTPPTLATITFTMIGEESYEELRSHVDPELFHEVSIINIKKNINIQQINTLDMTDVNLKESIVDWKKLLVQYVTSKYTTQSQAYIDMLESLHIV